MLNIAIILSTTREGRFGDQPARWFYELANTRDDLTLELVDLRDDPLPFFGPITPAVKRWREKIAGFDGYVFITAEYNHAPTAALKNALDYAKAEWHKKPAAFVGYGAVGAARAVEQLRLICAELQMAPLRSAVHIQGADFRAVAGGERDLSAIPYLQQGAETLLDELSWWGTTLKAGRERKALVAAAA